MNIDMKSWHYRFNKFFLNDSKSVPESLCPYFWATIGRLTAAVFAIAVILTLFFIVGFATMTGIGEEGFVNILSTALAPSGTTAIWMYPLVMVIGGIVIALGLGAVFGLMFVLIAVSTGISMLGQKYQGLTVKQRINSSDNLVIAYIRAKHRKICPKLNFMYGEKK